MFNVNILAYYSSMILISLFYGNKGDIGVIKEQGKITSRPQLENNLTKTSDESVITTAFTVGVEKIDDYEFKKVAEQTFLDIYDLGNETNNDDGFEKPRTERDAENGPSTSETKCLSCFANKTEGSSSCYEGTTDSLVMCSDAEQCYTELHPMYIRRGCMISHRGNRTFVCKCPLCNDKPSTDMTYYDYKSINDWEYDNIHLQRPLSGLDLMCKVCETLGSNHIADTNCRIGKTTDYMVCAHNQVCFINIDEDIGHVSRGCTSRPVFNSLYSFCETSKCNNQRFENPLQTFTDTLLQNENKKMAFRSIGNKLRLNWFSVLIVMKIDFIV